MNKKRVIKLDTVNAAFNAAKIIQDVPKDTEIIIKSGISGAKLARQFGVSRMTVSKWRRGICKPEAYNLLKLHHVAESLRSES